MTHARPDNVSPSVRPPTAALRPSRSPLAVVGTMVGGVGVAVGQAGDARIIVSTDLTRSTLVVQRIDAEGLQGLAPDGTAHRVPRDQLLAIFSPRTLPAPVPTGSELLQPGADDPSPEGLVTLVTRSAFNGRYAGASDQGQILLWESPLLGPLRLPLDALASVALRHAGAETSTTPAPARASDRLTLVNGDVLDGFINAMSDPVVIEVGGKPRTVPLSRVREASFANPATPWPRSCVWLDDGTILPFDAIESDAGPRSTTMLVTRAEGSGPLPGFALKMPFAQIHAAAFDMGMLQTLASIAPARQAPSEGRGWAPPIELSADPTTTPMGLADITLPGPMTVEWVLPRRAARFAAYAELPTTSRVWGDCVLVVELIEGGAARVVTRQRLHEGSPGVEINTEISVPRGGPEPRLRVTIDPGERGPIQDRVVLHTPLLLLSPAPPAAAPR
ncbi:MAG: hypothetical protein HRU70_04955 [Phycisphaeraceae bacterium]|nr:MAG: hypothetical protein HRU70_04955 [Phycisphaeraceae bacterium]